MPESTKTVSNHPIGLLSWPILIAWAVVWFATGNAISSRTQLVFDYVTLPSAPGWLEIFAASNSAVLVLSVVVLLMIYLVRNIPSDSGRRGRAVWLCLTAACSPLVLVGYRALANDGLPYSIWELLFFSGTTGMAVYVATNLLAPFQTRHRFNAQANSVSLWIVGLLAITCIGWWTWQANTFYQSFRLGFNDFGHFTQRIANTAEGRGFLLETPVLPPFWDHFNPGLLFFVPVWMLFPSVEWIFLLQATVLGLPAVLIAWIAKTSGASQREVCLWGLAWLLYPTVGQMNVAYTYGWHPVTIALPFLTLSILLLSQGRDRMAIVFALLACSFEEGVIVVVGCFCGAMWLKCWLAPESCDLLRLHRASGAWFLGLATSIVSFVAVYATSGLAEFQAGRFSMLGTTAREILVSPIYKPVEFWGLLLRPRNAVFLALTLIPVMVGGAWREWRIGLSLVLPLGVLILWQHQPAQSIAFQYTACLLPILFMMGIGARRSLNGKNIEGSLAVVICSSILSISVGNLPWSQSSLMDVLAVTYGESASEIRSIGSEDQQWLLAKIRSIRDENPSVLATGRIASHFVGCRDIETVGQYLQRREQLKKLDTTLPSPLQRFEFLVLDLRERFQQQEAELEQIRKEARESGFQLMESRYDIEIYQSLPSKPKA